MLGKAFDLLVDCALLLYSIEIACDKKKKTFDISLLPMGKMFEKLV